MERRPLFKQTLVKKEIKAEVNHISKGSLLLEWAGPGEVRTKATLSGGALLSMRPSAGHVTGPLSPSLYWSSNAISGLFSAPLIKAWSQNDKFLQTSHLTEPRPWTRLPPAPGVQPSGQIALNLSKTTATEVLLFKPSLIPGFGRF